MNAEKKRRRDKFGPEKAACTKVLKNGDFKDQRSNTATGNEDTAENLPSTSTAGVPQRHDYTAKLRPKKPEKKTTEQDSTMLGMRLLDTSMMTQAFNEAFSNHQQLSPNCQRLHFTVFQEQKVGVCWKMSLQCTNCKFKTPLQKMYREAATTGRGPKPAAPNVGLAVGLQDTPMGNTRCRLLLASMDIPPPARSGMQQKSNRVGQAIHQLNESDMAQKLEGVKTLNTDQGRPENEINIAMDGRYNSVTIASRRKPGQNASQLVGTACETMTDSQYIVAAAIQNKLCWTGAWLRGRGFKVECPGGHADCTANTHR
jgi:hypothetical protein